MQETQRSGGKRFAIPTSMGRISNLPDDSQIYAHNLKGPAERDLLCQARAEGSFSMQS